jgi:hypothetical protein
MPTRAALLQIATALAQSPGPLARCARGHPSIVLRCLLLALLARPALPRAACALDTGSAVWDLAPLGTLSFLNEHKWGYHWHACRPLDPRKTDAVCSLPPSTSIQVSNGHCYAMGGPAPPNSSALVGALGLQLDFSGGTPCGDTGKRRASRVELRCSDGPTRVLSVEEPEQCIYHAIAESRVGCPLACARDPGSGAVCGGAGRGVCGGGGGGEPPACRCAAGHGGAQCLPGGSAAQDAAPPPKGAAAAAAAAAAGASGAPPPSLAPLLFPALPALGALVLLAGGGLLALQALLQQAPSALSRARTLALLLAAVYVSFLAMGARLPELGVGLGAPSTSLKSALGALPPSPAALCPTSEEEGEGEGGSPPLADPAQQQQQQQPLLVIYGDLEKYWGAYAVKHFIVTANALKQRHGWKEYVPTSDNPRDSMEHMEARMAREFGRAPDTLLFLQDMAILDAEAYPRKFLARTSYVVWYDDTPRGGLPASQVAGLDDATLLLPTYEYLQVRNGPALAPLPRVWMPHGALPAFDLPFNVYPVEKVLLVGAVMGGYPLREVIKGKMEAGDGRFLQYQHPGWHPGSSLSHIEDFARAMHGHLACILDASNNNHLVAKVVEVPSTGSLLIMSDDLRDALAALGFVQGVHYLSYNRSSLDAVVDYALAPHNRRAVDGMRAAGQALAHARHSTRARVEAIHAAGLAAARVHGNRSALDVGPITVFPKYEDWEWKDPATARIYSGQEAYRRAQRLRALL